MSLSLSGALTQPLVNNWTGLLVRPSKGLAHIQCLQPWLSSSSSAEAEEFPARVLQQIISCHLRCLGKYPSTAAGKHSCLYTYLKMYPISFLHMRKKRSTTVQNLHKTSSERQYCLLLIISKKGLLINIQYWWSFGTHNTAKCCIPT